MAKKDFSADALDAFELERPKKAPKTEPSPEPTSAAVPAPVLIQESTPQPVQSPFIQTIPAQNTAVTSIKAAAPSPQQEELIRRTYYISPAQHKALKIRAATSDNPEEKDISKIVRAAIDMYLAKP